MEKLEQLLEQVENFEDEQVENFINVLVSKVETELKARTIKNLDTNKIECVRCKSINNIKKGA